MDERSLQEIIRGKILVVKPSSLGDVIHSLPFLYSVKEQMPGLRVHWVIAEQLAPLLEGHLLIERLWKIKKDEWKKPGRIFETGREFSALSRGLKEEKFDAVFDLQGLLRSAIITRAAGAGTTVGFKTAREGASLFYAHKVRVPGKTHAVQRYLRMAEFAGFRARVEFPLPVMEGFVPPLGHYAVLAPGARWPSKRWPAERFGELARRLPLESLIIGGAEEIGLAREVAGHSGGKAIEFAGKSSLKILVEIIRHAAFIVTNDSGPMHIAAALGVPVFAVFGPTDPELTGPYGKGARVVIRGRAMCSPCRKRTCKDMRCMEIDAGTVLEAIGKAL
ncbi:MAG: lipopolysaccharide heptosyltransferase I [Nitrospiraceae bacterium]|nr:lipopolysaccharide heptosyltransferase I [Nitrospiraceae bacterium]